MSIVQATGLRRTSISRPATEILRKCASQSPIVAWTAAAIAFGSTGVSRRGQRRAQTCGDGAYGFLHTFERVRRSRSGLRCRDRSVETLDRFGSSPTTPVEHPCHPAWFAKRLHEQPHHPVVFPRAVV
jgi:hypothetical protein